MSQSKNEPGNTRNRARCWCFTVNNPSYTNVSLRLLLEGTGGGIVKLVFQRERGSEGGTEHFQGVVQWKQQVDFNVVKALDRTIHWEKCRDLKASLIYCSKADTRIAGPWCVGWEPPETIRCIEPSNFNPWQRDLEELLDGPANDRTIYWCWEPSGGVGKTAYARYAVLKRNALVIGGRAVDIKFGVAKWVREHGRLGLGIFHFTRSNEEFVSYEAIEAIKDGLFFSSKYESGMCIFNPPAIVIFANFRPDESKLSADRWRIFFCGDDGLIPDGQVLLNE